MHNDPYAAASVAARLAQSAERKALNLVVVGSSPTVGVFHDIHLICMHAQPFIPYWSFGDELFWCGIQMLSPSLSSALNGFLIIISFLILYERSIRLQPNAFNSRSSCNDSVSEWLRRWTRNPLGSAREGSNPFAVAFNGHNKSYMNVKCLQIFVCKLKKQF